ncbi:NAD(P)H-binding protein [Nonomuraea sp. NPDC049784]|uniref:NAD(P)H-binding protein n=1 Tax=Nonomuraea sp. NPDC049784 TaxID=3154361 RepID=UPI0033F08A27
MEMVVFGARGNVGRHVAAGLLAAGERVRVTGRDPGKGGFPPGAESVAADLERPETLPAALEGAEKVFVYAKPAGVAGFVEAARSAGVRQVVLLSSAAVVAEGADRNPIALQHRAVETALEDSGLDWTFIRPGMFATNTLWWWREPIRDKRAVRLPYPESQTAPVHEKDLAALAVKALREPGHERQAYTVYGPESLTLRRQVELIGEAIGRAVTVEVISAEQAREELGRTMPPIGVEVIMKQWADRDGMPAQTSAVVEKVTGRAARTFAEWAVDHAGDFLGSR